MITTDQLFHNPKTGEQKPHSQAQRAAAERLLAAVNQLLQELGWGFPVDADTGCAISGSRGGNGDGGFRLPWSTTGRDHSSHQIRWVQDAQGFWHLDEERAEAAVDVFDPFNELDAMITDAILERYDLYREAPDATNGWCHLTRRRPFSGKRTFHP